MSYCRWSSDNFKCDIYAYESVYGGYEIHVATCRYKGTIPEVDMSFFENNTAENVQKFLESRKIQSAYLETCETEPIGLPCDGESYNMPDLQSFLQKMLQLKGIGYNIPDRVLESIKNELNRLPGKQ